MKRITQITQRQIKLNQREIDYTLRTSRKAKSLRLSIRCDGSLVVTQPRFLPNFFVEKLIVAKANWIISKIDFFKNRPIKPQLSSTEIFNAKNQARNLISEKIKFFNQIYNYQINQVRIKSQKTCWGSCSKKGNLNFNYKIIFLPEPLMDLIIVHEICHLAEFNHSQKFWQLVQKAIPDYKKLRKNLKQSQFL